MGDNNIINKQEKVSCIKGFEDFDTISIAKRLPKRRHLKSVKELTWEKEERLKNKLLISNSK
jgi:hypothetical protein